MVCCYLRTIKKEVEEAGNNKDFDSSFLAWKGDEHRKQHSGVVESVSEYGFKTEKGALIGQSERHTDLKFLFAL